MSVARAHRVVDREVEGGVDVGKDVDHPKTCHEQVVVTSPCVHLRHEGQDEPERHTHNQDVKGLLTGLLLLLFYYFYYPDIARLFHLLTACLVICLCACLSSFVVCFVVVVVVVESYLLFRLGGVVVMAIDSFGA